MSKSDNFYIRSDSESPIVIILYVDDLVIGGEHLVDINKVKSLLSDKFEMKDMKELHYFLCIKVRKYGLYAKLENYSFDGKQVEFLGYTISSSKSPKNIGMAIAMFGSRCSLFPRICWQLLGTYLQICPCFRFSSDSVGFHLVRIPSPGLPVPIRRDRFPNKFPTHSSMG